jgi:hypothetical protein
LPHASHRQSCQDRTDKRADVRLVEQDLDPCRDCVVVIPDTRQSAVTVIDQLYSSVVSCAPISSFFVVGISSSSGGNFIRVFTSEIRFVVVQSTNASMMQITVATSVAVCPASAVVDVVVVVVVRMEMLERFLSPTSTIRFAGSFGAVTGASVADSAARGRLRSTFGGRR